MTMTPDLPKQTALQKAELKPADLTYKPGKWARCINFLRVHVGLRPLELSHRWAEAKVREQEESARGKQIDNDIKIMKARQDFERIEIELREKKAGARILLAAADCKEEEARIKKLVRDQMEVEGQSPAEALEHLQNVMKLIELEGGHVEIQLPEIPEEEQTN